MQYVQVANTLSESGSVAVIPTDTLYGLVARAADEKAVTRLYKLKKRDQKPGTVIAASVDQLVEIGIKRRYLTAVQQFWPGPVSVIIACGPELNYLHQGKFSLAVRIPDVPVLITLLNQTGPLLTSSANKPGEPPAATMLEAKRIFGDSVDMYADGGDLSGRLPSTVIRIIDDAIMIVREGAVTIDESGRIQT